MVLSWQFARLVVFEWMLNTGNSALFGIGYFCIPIKTPQLCSGKQLLANCLIHLDLAFRLCLVRPEQPLV